MIKGISVNGIHTYHNYRMRMLRRSIGAPPKDSHLERVPYSSVTYDFDSVLGRSFGERELTYRFDFMERSSVIAADRIAEMLEKMRWTGYLELRDDMLPGYHFNAREPAVSWSEEHSVYTVDMVFPAAPAMLRDTHKLPYTASNVLIPDIDDDGKVDMTDASAILDAYVNISAGEPSGLTPEQEKRADADLDGKITAADATLVSDFYALVMTGKYSGMTVTQAWAAFLNDVKNTDREVY